jgi:glycogen synthase
MHILMFGWEFPPRVSGGLGTACLGIIEGLTVLGHEVLFVMPRQGTACAFPTVRVLSASDVLRCDDDGTFPVSSEPSGDRSGESMRHYPVPVDSPLSPYLTEHGYRSRLRSQTSPPDEENEGAASFLDLPGAYGPDLMAEVERYAAAAGRIAAGYPCDVIHAHDWMTVPAALRARQAHACPVIFHVHALEWDRSGEHANGDILAMEKAGLEAADHIIAVSHYTKEMIVRRCGIPAHRISVVHNAVSVHSQPVRRRRKKAADRKCVLFLGRITFQKGPEYFIEAAARVLEKLPDTRFIMAGAGDMMPRMIELAAEYGIGKNLHFPGFLSGEDIGKIFSLSDLYVMPSVSEPFGISPLEAALHGVPVIISNQSGVAEVLMHAIKVDFWDVRELAATMIAVLSQPALARELARHARRQVRRMTWDKAARKIVDVYRRVLP